jgi:uncharacterized membrane protein YheB (UPF0754 family)
VIIEQTEKSLLNPMVKVFFSIKSNSRIPAEIVDLSKPQCREKIVSHKSAEQWGITDMKTLWSGVAT